MPELERRRQPALEAGAPVDPERRPRGREPAPDERTRQPTGEQQSGRRDGPRRGGEWARCGPQRQDDERGRPAGERRDQMVEGALELVQVPPPADGAHLAPHAVERIGWRGLRHGIAARADDSAAIGVRSIACGVPDRDKETERLGVSCSPRTAASAAVTRMHRVPRRARCAGARVVASREARVGASHLSAALTASRAGGSGCSCSSG